MKNLNDVTQPKQDSLTVQSVARALELLHLVAAYEGPMPLTELVEKSGYNRTTVWRLIGTLEEFNYVEKDPITKSYQLGIAAFQLSFKSIVPYESLIRKLRPLMEQLRDEVGESVLFSIPKGQGTITLEQIDAPHSVRLVDYVNAYLPLTCTSNGKLLLSTLPREDLEVLIGQSIEPKTPYTITDKNELLTEIEESRKSGVAIAIGELDENENGISTGIYNQSDELVGFLSICGPSFRFTKEEVLKSKESLLLCAVEMKKILR